MTGPASRSPRFARFLPALAVLMIGCAWLAAAATRGDVQESFALKGQALARTFEYRVVPGTLTVEVELEATISGGTIYCRVVDPQGQERMSLHLERGTGRGTTGKVEALPGTWRLEVSASGATGRGIARFTSR